MRVRALATLILLLVLARPTWAGFALERSEGRLKILYDGAPVAIYVWNDPAIRRPYFTQVRSPGGTLLTRNLPPIARQDAVDHATMHPGLWLAFGDISGADFWRNKGTVRHAEFVEEPTSDDQAVRFTAHHVYESEGKTVCEESCRIALRKTTQGYLLDWESRFFGPGAFHFGDQEEMGLGIRVATGLTVKNGGTIASSEGRTNEKAVWGRPADWCDYAGPNGGILIMPDPKNVRRSWFHARDYGLLVANPFGRQAFTSGEPSRIVVAPGHHLTLRFGVLLHDGRADRAAAYRAFLASRPAP